MTRVRICPNGVFKRYSDRLAAEAVRDRIRVLTDGGVRTPACQVSRSGRALIYPLIRGRAGMAAVATFETGVLRQIMAQTAALHGATIPKNTHRFDPLGKIVSRLDCTAECAYQRIINDALEDIDRARRQYRLIHGDLHAGQFIIDGGGYVWLLDLDDVAVGDPEADLGNFAAHLATRPETSLQSPLDAMRHWQTEVLNAYAKTGKTANGFLTDAYGRIALVRRALKKAERGDRNIDLLLRRDFGAA